MLPYFYQSTVPAKPGLFVLDEATSKHCILVLRMKPGASLLLTDGKGLLAQAEITGDHRKHCSVHIHSVEQQVNSEPAFSLALAFTKNNSRNEWLLEKTTELGIRHIYPLLTKRGEKDNLKMERLNGILVSAMLQSQQTFLPTLHAPISLKDLLSLPSNQKFIAHCLKDEERVDYLKKLEKGKDALVLIGPEGDFDQAEIEFCIDHGCQPVSFGPHRLRTETAGMYACALFNAVNNA